MIALRSLAVTLLLNPLPPAMAAPAPSAAAACAQPGQWLIPPAKGTGLAASPVVAAELLDQLARKPVVLLGENHDSADDHRWQLDVLTALQQRPPAGTRLPLLIGCAGWSPKIVVRSPANTEPSHP